MKANKFIEQFGLKRAEEVLQKADDGAIMYVIDLDYYAAGITTEDYVLLSQLKRFVESHNLVNNYGGLNNAKDFVSGYTKSQLSKKVYSPMLRLKQAIADVERD